jgi:hypothetical protein
MTNETSDIDKALLLWAGADFAGAIALIKASTQEGIVERVRANIAPVYYTLYDNMIAEV